MCGIARFGKTTAGMFRTVLYAAYVCFFWFFSNKKKIKHDVLFSDEREKKTKGEKRETELLDRKPDEPVALKRKPLHQRRHTTRDTRGQSDKTCLNASYTHTHPAISATI